jgi:lipoate-protein ligase B
MDSSSICAVLRLGLVEYRAAWDFQNRLAAEIAAGARPDTLLLLEHPHTFTFGRRGRLENLLWDQAELQRRGVAVHWVDRGGDVTYHGPGQLVGYPLLGLGIPGNQTGGLEEGRLPQADYTGYLRKLERTIIHCLEQFGVQAVQVEGLTGVWAPRPNKGSSKGQNNQTVEQQKGTTNGRLEKIAAIGVKVDARGITRHGFALNLACDPVYWQGIIGCGLAGYAACNLADLLTAPPSMLEVMDAMERVFGRVFGYRMTMI